jgi:hypothetical protein
MLKLNDRGSLLIPLVLTGTLLLLALVFGLWAFAGMQDYKNNSDEKVAEAVTVAEQNLTIKKDAEFAEIQKSPYKTYQGPATLGTVTITHPKSWSSYVVDKAIGATQLSGYMQPDVVPSIDSTVNFALRFEVVDTAYDSVLKSFDSSVKSGKVAVSAYRAPKVDSQLGSRLEGEISTKKQGNLVLLPLRDKTLKIWTEGQDYKTDFQVVLDNLTFIP